MARLRSLLAAAALAAVALTGCGGSGPPTVSVALDFTPNAVHAPLFTAVREGLDRRHGIRLVIRPPGAQPNSLGLLTSGRVDIGLLDIQDLGLAVEHGAAVVGIGALVQRPLSAIIAQPGVRRPRDLEGRLVGVSGLPSDPAFLRAIIDHDGGDFSRVRLVTIGFSAVSSMLTRRVAAVPAFWNAEGVALRRHGVPVREFRVEDYGAPVFPEVIVVTTAAELRTRHAVLRRALAAIADGTRAALADPGPAAAQIARAADASPGLVRAQLAAVAPALRPPLRLNRTAVERWARFAARIGILPRVPNVARAFDFSLARGL